MGGALTVLYGKYMFESVPFKGMASLAKIYLRTCSTC